LIGTGHTADTCKAGETCSNCAKQHPTGECRATRAEFQCATCKKDKRPDDHAAWDRQCPAFIEEKARLRNKKPENHFRFFPTEFQDWTWVRHEDSLADGYADRWMGNDTGRGPNHMRNSRHDDGWGRPLGQGTSGHASRWEGEGNQPSAIHRRGHSDRERSQRTNKKLGEDRRQEERSQSRGRPARQEPLKDKANRQSSLISWLRDTSHEAGSGRKQNETEHLPPRANRR
jgi:hypothetical protein